MYTTGFDNDKYLQMLRLNPMSESYDINEYEKFEQFVVDIVTGKLGPVAKDPQNFTRRMSYELLSRKEKIKFLFFK